MLERLSIPPYQLGDNRTGADNQQGRPDSGTLNDYTSATPEGVKIESALHGDMQNAAETTASRGKCFGVTVKSQCKINNVVLGKPRYMLGHPWIRRYERESRDNLSGVGQSAGNLERA